MIYALRIHSDYLTFVRHIKKPSFRAATYATIEHHSLLYGLPEQLSGVFTRWMDD